MSTLTAKIASDTSSARRSRCIASGTSWVQNVTRRDQRSRFDRYSSLCKAEARLFRYIVMRDCG